jgi:hypothetical protein
VSAELAAVAVVALAFGWQLWRIGRLLATVGAVLKELHTEAQASAAERERRRANEAAEALYDAETVRAARLIVSALDTLDECQPCRERLERMIDRRRLWPRQPATATSFATPTRHP